MVKNVLIILKPGKDMNIKTFKLAAGFLITEARKGIYQNHIIARELENSLKEEKIPDNSLFVSFKEFFSFVKKISEILNKEPLDYKTVNAYITGVGANDINGSEILSKMIQETTKLNINVSLSLPPTHNTYLLCIAKIHPNFNECLVRPARVLNNEKVLFLWDINKNNYQISSGETRKVDFIIDAKKDVMVGRDVLN